MQCVGSIVDKQVLDRTRQVEILKRGLFCSDIELLELLEQATCFGWAETVLLWRKETYMSIRLKSVQRAETLIS